MTAARLVMNAPQWRLAPDHSDSAVALATDLDETGRAFDSRDLRETRVPASPKRLDGAVIVFDLDGTLVHTAPDLMSALNTVLREEGLPALPVEAAPMFVGRGVKVMLERGFQADGRPLDEASFPRLFDRYIGLYLEHCADQSRPYPGVIEALDRLADEGATLAVCTNKRTDLSLAVMDALGLTSRFKAIVGADQAPHPKPDASHLLHTIALAGGDPGRAVMVGDSINDVLAARNAKVPVVLVSFGYTDIPPKDMDADALIDGFDELDAQVERLLG
jgi:phosphoglycolate phosphatase